MVGVSETLNCRVKLDVVSSVQSIDFLVVQSQYFFRYTQTDVRSMVLMVILLHFDK